MIGRPGPAGCDLNWPSVRLTAAGLPPANLSPDLLNRKELVPPNCAGSIPKADAFMGFLEEMTMGDEATPAKPVEETQATTPGVEMANDEGGVPEEADQSDDTDAKGAPKR
jgi:hypothetical protein